MDNLTMVFLGTHFFTFDLPFTEEFETVCELSRLDRLRSEDDLEFEYVQALCVETGSGFVSREEVQWFLCFPVERKRKGYYVPRTESVPPSGKNVFYSFYSYRFEVPLNSPVRVVPDLDSLNLLSPRRGDKLVVVRCNNWRWDEEGAALVRWKDIIETEIIHESEVLVP